MAQAFCKPITRVPDYAVVSVSVPTGKTYAAGQVVVLDTIDTTGYANHSVFVGNAPTDIKTATLAIIINDGFEQLSDGRRPAGQPDYTQYPMTEGSVVTAIKLVDGMRFQVSTGALVAGASPVVGQYLIPANNLTTLTTSATKTAQDCFKVLIQTDIRAGGQFGGSLASGFIPAWIVMADTKNYIA